MASLVVLTGVLLSAGCEGSAAPGRLSSQANLFDAVSSSPSQQQQDLSAFFHELSRLKSGQIAHVNILQLGDSHTAGDFFSGRLRDQFQSQFGNGGRGMMPPGFAFQGIDQRHFKFYQNASWTIENSLKSPLPGPYGISGFVAQSQAAGAHMTLSANGPDDRFDEARVDYLKRPGGGRFEVLADGAVVASLSTNGPAGDTGRFVVHGRGPMNSLEIIANAPDIGITAWSAQSHDPGIVLTSHGVVGATADLFNRWTPRVVEADIASLHPALIIVAYGTNEAFDRDFKPDLYEQNFSHVLSTLKEDAPYASILVVGPPDSERADQACLISHAPLSTCSWSRPPALDRVRSIQRELARSEGAAFWDWSSVMPDGMSVWVEQGLARSDHVHFTQNGYEVAADRLFNWLMAGYAALVPEAGGGGRF